MDALFELVRASPWPVIAAVITLAAMVLVAIHRDGGDRSLPDLAAIDLALPLREQRSNNGTQQDLAAIRTVVRGQQWRKQASPQFRNFP